MHQFRLDVTVMAADHSHKPKAGALGALLAITAVMAAPIVAVLIAAASGEADGFVSPQLSRYMSGTFLLCLLAGAGASLIGAGAAALVSLTDFPGRRILAVLLAAPFAIPAYIAAYAYGDVLGPLGPVATFFGTGAVPEIRSLPGAAFILMLMTYPYIYLAVAASLSARSGALMEAARMLGATPARAASGVLIAAGRPAFAGGLALALMEIAADFGVADYFGVQTLSVGIFRTWFGRGDLGAATQIAAALFLFALIFVILEEAGRRGGAADSARTQRKSSRIRLSPAHSTMTIILLSLPVIFGFLLPVSVLAAKIEAVASPAALRGLTDAALNSALVAIVAAAGAVAIALALAYAARQTRSRAKKALVRVATLGYAVPGAVIAIGILALSTSTSSFLGTGAAGGLAILIYAYIARFLTASFNAAAGGLAQISTQMDAAARTLGARSGKILTQLHWPQARGAALAGGAIVAVDVAKELPATLLLRPFNFETLATRTYRLASDERIIDAAPAALLLIGLGLVPVMMIAGTAFSTPTRRRDKRGAMPPATDPDTAPAMPTAG